jgi:hypothetical protein
MTDPNEHDGHDEERAAAAAAHDAPPSGGAIVDDALGEGGPGPASDDEEAD